eukprot:2561083-Pleurochrysis_carterae.AAC.2
MLRRCCSNDGLQSLITATPRCSDEHSCARAGRGKNLPCSSRFFRGSPLLVRAAAESGLPPTSQRLLPRPRRLPAAPAGSHIGRTGAGPTAGRTTARARARVMERVMARATARRRAVRLAAAATRMPLAGGEAPHSRARVTPSWR